MKTRRRRAVAAVSAVAIALGGSALALERVAGPAFPSWIGAAYAQEEGGGHGGGGESGGGGGKGGGGESGGGHGGGGMGGGHGGGGGMGGGHNPGEETGGEEAKGHGTRFQHQGHAGGQHGRQGSAHQAGGDRFGGGSGLRGNDQVPEGVGRYGAGFDALSAPDQGRFRYWGGWSLPEDVTGTLTTYSATSPTTSESIPGPGSGPSVNARSSLDAPSRCEGVGGGMPAAQQFSGGNLLRLNAARGMVDPAFAASGKVGSPYLMGSLQSELVKDRPNAELAGTYLGLVAKVPVTAATVKSIGSQLCAVVSDAQAQEIAQVAEQQRLALISAAPASGGAGDGKAQ